MLRLRYLKVYQKKIGFQFVGHRVKLPNNHEYQAMLWYRFFWFCVPASVFYVLRKLFVEDEDPQ